MKKQPQQEFTMEHPIFWMGMLVFGILLFGGLWAFYFPPGL